MKFIHTSDWHIGRQFHNVSLLDEQLHVLKQLKNYARDQEVDVIVIAGDIFDRAVPPAEAVDALDNFLDEIATELNIPIIMISGNHDSAKRLRFGARQMQQSGLHILSNIADITTPIILETQTGPVHFYGIPFHDPVEVREAFNCDVKTFDDAHTHLVELIKVAKTTSIPSVVISHCFMDGAEVSDSERPLSIGGADRVSYQPLESFDYVALGHLHAPQSKGAEHIRYSGSLLKYSFSEYQQKKGITLVELDKKGFVSAQHLELIPKRDVRVLEGCLADLLEEGKDDPHNDDYIFARLTDKQDILDPMGQLRRLYSNILQLERTQFVLASGSRLVADVSLKRSEEQVFNDFFEQVIGHDLIEDQNALLLEIINEAKVKLEDQR
jgi:exonuclease SbcD